MKDYTLMFVIIDDLIDEVEKIEETLIVNHTLNQVICLENIKEIYDLIPYIIMIGIILNITGNLIKMTFKVPSKYIVWILLILSLLINFIFYGFTFESLFVGFISFSFSVSSYDLAKYFTKIRNRK